MKQFLLDISNRQNHLHLHTIGVVHLNPLNTSPFLDVNKYYFPMEIEKMLETSAVSAALAIKVVLFAN